MAYAHWPITQELRREERHPADFTALLLAYRFRRECRVVDLSRNGAMLEVEEPPARGDEVLFKKDGIEAVATVAWTKSDSCGLAFHKPIELTSLLRKGRATRGFA